MKITTDEIAYVAKLARLHLSDSEVEAMAGQLDSILSYVDKLNELDTRDIPTTTHAIAVENAFRDDTVRTSLGQEESLANAPIKTQEAFVVPRVI